HRRHVTFTIAVDLTRLGGLIAPTLAAGGWQVDGFSVERMAVATPALYTAMADQRIHAVERSTELDQAVGAARRRPLGTDTGGRFTWYTADRQADLAPLIALTLAHALVLEAETTAAPVWAVVER